MREILETLVRWFSFLWEGGHYRITNSMVSTSFGGNAHVVVSSSALKMRIVRERGQMFVDFQEPWGDDDGEWYSIDLVRRLLTGERQRSAELDEDYAVFLRESLPDIAARFSTEEEFQQTRRRLVDLKKVRAKEMFG